MQVERVEDLPLRIRDQAKKKYQKALKKRIRSDLKDKHYSEKCAPAKEKSKYGNEKVELDGHLFDSKREARYYLLLRQFEKDGKITDLQLQPKFVLQDSFEYAGHNEKPITYIGDFYYKTGNKVTVVDVKGFRTDVYKIKRKLFLCKYPEIEFIEV